ncbi:hypothetical protein EB796_003436 [Bugula neritina]|uniref:Uncharacterized protein n=1 Tax=Bugula neritina TaxID=10212 RepID=A0A7J7KJ38_BUGNE|nr:hypothetical protein EB796_003436 [Bugula neritina]
MFVSAVTVLMLLAIGSTLGSEQNCQVTDFVSIPGYQIYAITPHPILSDTFLVGTSNGMHMVAQGGSSALISSGEIHGVETTSDGLILISAKAENCIKSADLTTLAPSAWAGRCSSSGYVDGESPDT